MKKGLLILFYITSVLTLYPIDRIAKDFLEAKHLNTGVILGCNNTRKEIVNLWKYLHDYRTKYFNLKTALGLQANITLNQTVYHLGVILQGDCEDANDYFQLCGREKLIGSVHKWLVITNNEDFSPIFENVSLHIDSNVHVAVPDDETKKNYIIYDVYNPSFEHGGDLKVLKFGNWSEENGYNANTTTSKYWFRKNMTGVRFKSAVVIPKQFNLTVEEYLANDSDSEVNSMHRFQAVTVKHCQDMYNFS